VFSELKVLKFNRDFVIILNVKGGYMNFLSSKTTLFLWIVLFCLIFVSTSFGRLVKDDSYTKVKIREYSEISQEVKENLLSFFKDQTRRSVIYIWDFYNRTPYDINTKKIKDDISTLLLESKKFKLVDDAVVQLALKELNLSATGLLDQSYIKEFGNRTGAEYILYGAINNNPLVGGEYNMSLNLKLIKIETAEIVWSYELGLNRKDFKTSVDAVIDQAVFKSPKSLLKEWDSINQDSVASYGKPINTISVFAIKTSGDVDENSVVDKLTSALVQAKIPNVKVVDRNNLAKIIEQIKAEGYDEAGFYKTKKEFGKFYGVDAFLYGYLTKDPDTSKTELNLKLAMVESATVDWGNKFEATQTSAERESIGKVQQKEFSEKVSQTTGAVVGAVGEVLGFVLSSPGIGINLSFGWLGGFTTPGMTSKDRYSGNDLFKDQFQMLSANVSIEFFRFRLWKHLYFEAGVKLWGGEYTTPDESEYVGYPFLTSATFSGFTPTISVRYVTEKEPRTSVRVGILPLIGIGKISSRVEGLFDKTLTNQYGGIYYETWKFWFDESLTSAFPVQNWPMEVEIGFDADGFYPSILFGVWFPPEGYNGYSKFEWELGFNFRIPIFWWHPLSFLYDKYLWE
jgi:PBP1b-binding outer membrane lipoprotein LpoB